MENDKKLTKTEKMLLGLLTLSVVVGFYNGYKVNKDFNQEPIKIEYRDLNRDGIDDRVISSEAGLDQIQFAVKKQDGTIKYFTSRQMRKNAEANLETELDSLRTKYSK